jgi:hypothetical protein
MTVRQILIACLAINFALVSEQSMSAEIPEADPDKGLVVFYRNKNFKGGAVRFNVQHSDGVIGTLTNGSVLYTYLEPGQHTFWSQVISQDSVTLTVEAGKIYYVEGRTQLGIYAGRPKFSQASESKAKADLEKL